MPVEVVTENRKEQPAEIRFVGGRSRRTIWPQILADVIGVPVVVPPILEATSLGAALCAFVGASVFGSLEEAVSATAGTPRHFEPNSANLAAYDEAYERWRSLFGHLLDAADRGLIPHVWRGAGA